jgi:hypothetical protein
MVQTSVKGIEQDLVLGRVENHACDAVSPTDHFHPARIHELIIVPFFRKP